MTISELKPQLLKPKVVTPQCCVPVDPPTHNPEWRQKRYPRIRPGFDHSKCQRPSTIMIDGNPYCRPHAGQKALQLWLDGKLYKKGSHT